MDSSASDQLAGSTAQVTLRPRFHFDRSIRLGEFLTSITVVLSAIGLYLSLAKDRELRVHEQAAHIRDAGGLTLAKVDRLQGLSLSVFDDLQPVYVEVSEHFGSARNAVETRDLLWKRTNDVRLRHQSRVRDEQIETGYVGLVGFDPDVRTTFRSVLKGRSNLEDEMFDTLMAKNQETVFSFEGQKSYTSAQMGNAFRATAEQVRKDYESKVVRTLEPLQSMLIAVLTASDDELVRKHR